MQILILLLIVTSSLFGQEYIFSGEFGNFEAASSIAVSPSGFIYITDTESDEVYKLDTLGSLKKTIGGYGWQESSFDDPVDVYATTLNVYVTDKNNHRIQAFDKDLNFISMLSRQDDNNSNESDRQDFGYPLSCVISNMGDLYLLDSENNKILKFDLNGNFSMHFGGFDAGNFSLRSPRKLSVTQDNKIVVLDDSSLVVFDQFGTGLARIKLNDLYSDIKINFNDLLVVSPGRLLYANLREPQITLREIKLTGYDSGIEGNIKSGAVFGNSLYVVTGNSVAVFKKKKG